MKKINELTTNPETVIEMLKDNSKAMQFLYNQCGFDFCKPFEVVKRCGSFTLNMIKTAINRETLDNLNIYILLKRVDRCGSTEKDLYAVEVNPSRVIGAQYGDLCRSWYVFNINYFYGVSSFEDVRKKSTKYIYIIYQDAKYKRDPKNNPDETYNADTAKRYKLIEAHHVYYKSGAKYEKCLDEITIKDRESNAHPFKFKFAFSYSAPYTEAGEIIDKSGYIICSRRKELKRRAAALLAERAKAEYLRQDYSAEIVKIHQDIQQTARKAGEQLRNAEFESDFKRIKECCNMLECATYYLENHEKQTEEKKFANIQDVLNSFQRINNKIDAAKKLLEPIQPGEFHAIAAQELPPEDIDHHETDLYIKLSSKAAALVNRLTTKALLTTFKSQTNDDLWYELPFCYNPAIEAGNC